MVKTKAKIFQVFYTILKIGTIGFGGGPATIPLFHREFVEKYKYLEEEEFSDMLAVANALPGPTQTKLSGYIGYRLNGFMGMILGLLGIILPNLLIMLLAYSWLLHNIDKPWVSGLTKAVLPVVTVLMLNLTIKFFKKSNQSLGIARNIILLIIGIVVLKVFDIYAVLLIILLLIIAFIPKLKEITRFLLIGGISLLMILFFQLRLNNSLSKLFSHIHLFSNHSGSRYMDIFFSFFIPGITGFGGGPASVGLVQNEVISHFHLISADSFAQAFAVQAMLPGVTATKLAGSIGYQVGNFWGIIIGVLAYSLPSLILMIVLLKLINKYKESPVVKRLTSYVGPVITVLLGGLTYKVFNNSLAIGTSVLMGWIQTIALILISFVLLNKYKIHPFFVIIFAMAYGALSSFIF